MKHSYFPMLFRLASCSDCAPAPDSENPSPTNNRYTRFYEVYKFWKTEVVLLT